MRPKGQVPDRKIFMVSYFHNRRRNGEAMGPIVQPEAHEFCLGVVK